MISSRWEETETNIKCPFWYTSDGVINSNFFCNVRDCFKPEAVYDTTREIIDESKKMNNIACRVSL